MEKVIEALDKLKLAIAKINELKDGEVDET